MKVFFAILFLLCFSRMADCQWQSLNGPYGSGISKLAQSGNNLFAVSGYDLFYSYISDHVWTKYKWGNLLRKDDYILDVYASGRVIIVRSSITDLISLDTGKTWKAAIIGGLIIGNIDNKWFIDDYYSHSLWMSDDSLSNWVFCDSSQYIDNAALEIHDSTIYSLKHYSLSKSTDFGKTWVDIYPSENVISYTAASNFIYVNTYAGFFMSGDYGKTWNKCSDSIEYLSTKSMAADAKTVFAATDDRGLLRSIDNGHTWVSCNLLLDNVQTVQLYNDMLWASTYHGLYYSTDNGDHWTAKSDWSFNHEGIYSISVHNGNMLVAAEGGCYRSKMNQFTWLPAMRGIPEITGSLFSFDDTIFSLSTAGSYKTSDEGNSWVSITGFLTQRVIEIDGKDIYAQDNKLLLHTSDNGNSWDTIFSQLIGGIGLFKKIDGVLFMSIPDGGIFRSANNGTTWIRIADEIFNGQGDAYFTSLVKHDGGLLASTYMGLCRSSDAGVSWSIVCDTYDCQQFQTLLSTNMTLLATSPAGVFISSDQGAHWQKNNIGLRDTAVHGLAIYDDFIYLYGNDGLWRRSVANLGVSEYGNLNTANPHLQSYPNPTLSSATIQFEIPASGFVVVEIYNALGEKISTLNSKDMEAGVHEVRWDAKGIAKGVYYCRLHCEGITETKAIHLQ